jgi:hypothetical protein
MSTVHIPTMVDVDALGEGSKRLRDGRIVHSMGMKLDYLTTANQAIGDFNEVAEIASRSEEGYEGFSAMDVAFRILGSRLNDIAIRASELEDPVLLAVLRSIGMVRDDVVTLVQMGEEGSPSVLMPGLGPCREELTPEERTSIGAAVRLGVHHDEEWTLAMQADQTSDDAVMEWIASSIEGGSMDSTSCPRWFVGRWKLHVRAGP